MPRSEQLGGYLNDHLAGAVAATQLIDRMIETNGDTPSGPLLRGLASEIDADRRVLEHLIDELGFTQSPMKQAGAWMAEKLSRLKLSDAMSGSAELTRMLELEALSLGIAGKLAMWRALETIADTDPALKEPDFEDLAGRARRQFDEVERARIDAARQALRQ